MRNEGNENLVWIGSNVPMDMDQQKKGRLIGLDWGTTSLRSYLLGENGAILEQRSFPLGVMQLQEQIEHAHESTPAFESALEQSCGDWMCQMPSLPILTAGMVGSSQGWKEVPYLSVPCDLSMLHNYLAPLENRWRKEIYCVPGLLQSGSLPEIMRGEETQVFGALSDGGQVTLPLTKTFFSPRFGMLTDKFGVGWMIMVAQ